MGITRINGEVIGIIRLSCRFGPRWRRNLFSEHHLSAIPIRICAYILSPIPGKRVVSAVFIGSANRPIFTLWIDLRQRCAADDGKKLKMHKESSDNLRPAERGAP